jgi:hypothetical protein
MALQSDLAKSALNLRYKEGVHLNGKDIIKSKKFSNVKVSAANQSIYDTASALSPLMKYPVLDVVRIDDTVLMDI